MNFFGHIHSHSWKACGSTFIIVCGSTFIIVLFNDLERKNFWNDFFSWLSFPYSSSSKTTAALFRVNSWSLRDVQVDANISGDWARIIIDELSLLFFLFLCLTLSINTQKQCFANLSAVIFLIPALESFNVTYNLHIWLGIPVTKCFKGEFEMNYWQLYLL